MNLIYHCCRQRAGPLVINAAGICPKYSPSGQAAKPASQYRRCCANRSPLDRLEARLALIGWDATHYVLTFDDAHLPKKYGGVQAALKNFIKSARRWRSKCGKPPDFDWAAVIEGQHGEKRYHIHFVCDYSDLSPAEVVHLWRYGIIPPDEEERIGTPVLLDKQGFFRLARYLTKEPRDGTIIPLGKHEFSTSQSLAAKVPPPKLWVADALRFTPPRGAICVQPERGERMAPRPTPYGLYWRREWLVPDWTPACRRAMLRMGYIDEVFEHELSLSLRARPRATYLQ